jgi:hypothetical protein
MCVIEGEWWNGDGCVAAGAFLTYAGHHLAGHAEPRTTGLYDRRKKKVTRNIVERIPI